jgi:type III secretory pathway component EscV
VRLALARNIVARLLPPGQDSLSVIHVDKDVEAKLRSALVVRPDGPLLGLSPEACEAVRQSLSTALAQAQLRHPVIALPADLRRAASRLFRGSFPQLAFLSHDELATAGILGKGVARMTMGTQA